MPNRILHERICVSETIAQLTADEERFFYRLIVQCDDYGRFDGRASVIRARCFALQLDTVTDHAVAGWLDVLTSVGLVAMYEVDGRSFLQVTTWERYQQTRAKRSKFPDPLDHSPASASNGYQPPAHVPVSGIRESRIENRSSVSEKRESDGDGEPEHGADAPPEPKTRGKAGRTAAPPDFQPNEADYAAGTALGMDADEVDSKAVACLDYWRGRGETRADWHATLRTWLRNAPQFDQPRASPGQRSGSYRPPPNGLRSGLPTEASAYLETRTGTLTRR